MNQGLNGKRKGAFWRWVVKTVLTVVDEVPIIGHAIVDAVQDNTNVDEWSGYTDRVAVDGAEYEPNAAEQAVLTAWIDKTFKPFYQALTNDLGQAFAKTDVKQQLEGINKAMARMCSFTAYFLNHETTGLSHDAIIFRNDAISELLQPVSDMISDTLSATGIQFDSIPTKLIPAQDPVTNFVPGQALCPQYFIKAGTPLETIQNTSIPKPANVNTVIPQGGTNPSGNGVVTTTTQGNGKKWLGLAVLVGLIMYAASDRKKKK